ncbi:MAG: molybdopterin-dependent oxidoreductase [Eggerthellaceae bacterium]|nr:molybdopterin-dependent oxidoreductase [Eggerthellaceae bacterium]
MSEPIKTAGLTRRSFLKATGAVAGATALAGGAGSLTALAEDYSSGQTAGAEEEIFCGVCRGNCFGQCKINVHVRDGKVVKTSRRAFNSWPKGGAWDRICLRGLSHPYTVYGEQRIQYPMKRVGERGSGEWERISWDEAIKTITDEWKRIQAEYGEQAVAYTRGSGNLASINGVGSPLFNVLFNKINATQVKIARDQANTRGINRVVGSLGDWVLNSTQDYINSKTVFVWGANITDAQAQDWPHIANAIDAGVKLVVIDPIYTQLAAKADWWIPIQPATDAALTLAMMNVMINEDAINKPFMKSYTVAPFLVRSDNGKFLHMSDLGVAPKEVAVAPEEQNIDAARSSSVNYGSTGGSSDGTTKLVDPYAVLDVDGVVKAVEDAADPQIEGTYICNGVECKTAYGLLKEEVLEYTPEYAAEICKIPAEDIVELAHLALDGPCIHRLGWGSNSYTNGVHAAHAAITMAALTGQIGYSGAGTGACNWNAGSGTNMLVPNMTAAKNPLISALFLPEIMRTGKYMGKDHPIKALYVYSGNPITNQVNTNEYLKDIVGNLEFLVTADYNYSDTVHYSDIVLPACHWFEAEDIVLLTGAQCYEYNAKAIEPLYESKTDSDILRLLAAGMGYPDLFPLTDEEYCHKMLDTKALAARGISFDALKEKEDIYYKSVEPWIPWAGNKFMTPSGRMEFYVEEPELQFDMGQDYDREREHLPRYFNPTEAYEGSPQWDKYKLILLSERPRYRVHSMMSDNKYLRELDPEPTVKINPEDAKSRGLSDGEYVEVYNDRGHAVARLVFNDAVRPGCMVYPKSWQMSQHKAGCWSELLTSAYDPVGVNESYFDNLVEVRSWKEA